ncbi:hypothetical protein PG994_003810 [Apiospora phragmitis]|uniref:Uncharacterized protein n=1 Tax=Apiospora phragmitis TaxID=2905665 RepID=A0ABR1VZA5_9PEZI
MGNTADFLASLPEPIRNPNNCYAEKLAGIPYSYGYRPSLAAGVSFIVLFAFAVVYHLVLSHNKKRWASVALAYGAATEMIGWIGRTWGSQCPYNQHAYLMQMIPLTIAPVFFTAALYMLLGQLIQVSGPESSVLPARLYTIVFLTSAFLSLLIQLVGGAVTASASSKGEVTPAGVNTIVAGLVFQLATMVVFAGLAVDFLRRISSSRSSSIGGGGGGRSLKNYYTVLAALFISLTCIVVRSLFRVVELTWMGPSMLHERNFVALDAFLMVAAVWVFIILDPARIIDQNADLLPPPAAHQSSLGKEVEEEEVEGGRGSSSNEGKGYSVQHHAY